MTTADIRNIVQDQAEGWALIGAPALMERFVLRNGQVCKGGKLPTGYRRGRAKQCFMNSIKLVTRKPGLRYVEGYTMGDEIPFLIHHGWALDADDRVIDVTLPEPDRYQYIGIVMTRERMLDEVSRLDVYGVLDTGCGLNADFMFRHDPPLEAIVKKVIADGKNYRAILQSNHEERTDQ